MPKVGRRQKPFESATGPIPGLAREKDGRWRIIATGKRFTEHDEEKAIDQFRRMTKKTEPLVYLGKDDDDGRKAIRSPKSRIHDFADEQKLFDWFREQLLNRPVYVAERTRLPQLAAFEHLQIPRSVPLSKLREAYRLHAAVKEQHRNSALAKFDHIVEFANAKTLDDLTTEKLVLYRDSIEKSVKESSSRVAYYSRIKTVIRFGLKRGVNEASISSCLNRMKVLWTDVPMPTKKPQPISKENFQTLFKAAKGTKWEAFLLLGLNLCMSVEEVCGLKWEYFNFEEKTLFQIRGKTERKRIPRAAVLWDETIEILKRIPRKGEYVLISTHGTRYNKNTIVNDFRDWVTKLNVKVTFQSLRRGAYTTAVYNSKKHGAIDDREAKVLAGHACGMSDSYVARHPEFAKPACDAVYARYFGA